MTTIHQPQGLQLGTTRPSAGLSQLPKIVPHYTPQGLAGITVASRKLHQLKGLWLYCAWWLSSEPQTMWRIHPMISDKTNVFHWILNTTLEEQHHLGGLLTAHQVSVRSLVWGSFSCLSTGNCALLGILAFCIKTLGSKVLIVFNKLLSETCVLTGDLKGNFQMCKCVSR